MKIKLFISSFSLMLAFVYSDAQTTRYLMPPVKIQTALINPEDKSAKSDKEDFVKKNMMCTFPITVNSLPITCGSSSHDGIASVTPSGGSPPYTYLWTPGGQTTATITGLTVGTYSVTVTDSLGCTAAGSAVITSNVPVVTSSATPSHISAGDSTLLSATCSAPATFTWAGGFVTNMHLQNTYAHPPVTTVYTVTVVSDSGCVMVMYDTVWVTGCTFALRDSTTYFYCAGMGGSATAIPSGGTLPYTYLWSPGGQTTATITGLTAGGYSVTVMDAAGCMATKAIPIDTGKITISASVNPIAIAAGDSALITALCNVPATFSWSPSATVRNPNADSTYAYPAVTTMYTVTATTACGTFTDSALVTVNCFALNMTSTPYYCASSYEGSATVAPTGGTPPYTYLWAPGGQTTASITGLAPGTYSVTVHDNTNCSSIAMVTIARGTPTLIATATPSHIAAGDSTNLVATCNIPAKFSWSPSTNVTNPNIPNTWAHPPVTTVYTVTARTDTCGIIAVAYDTVWVTGCSLTLSDSTTPYTCPAYEGSATVTASGGTPPYTYLWAPGGQTTATVTGLSAGGYTVTVTDSAGCRNTKAITIATTTVTYTITGAPTYINAGDSALLDASCSVPATYSWSPSATVRNPNNDSTYAYPAVTTDYTVTITTACGTFIDSVLVNLNCFNLSMSATTAYMCSSYDGTATVTPSGGTPPYTYLWTPTGKTTATITGLSPGTYSVTVHDNTGCSAVNSISVSSAAISLTVSAFPPVIALGDSSYLSVSCPVYATYSWAPATSLSCTTCAHPWATPTVTTVYTVTAIDSCGQTLYGYDTVVVANCTNNYNEPICIVTIDTANNRPVIIWGRTNSPPATGSYTVYKENSSFVFIPIDNQPLHALSDYIDTSSNPSLGPISYKLATDDSCGQSALSPVHTTVFLTVTSGFNVNILNWTAYIGFTPSWYIIYRGPSMGALVKIDSVLNTVLTYHDTLPPVGSIYMVEAVNPFGTCLPTYKIKHHSLSSRDLTGSYSNGYNTIINAVQPVATASMNLNIYPNPNNGTFTIQSSVVGLVPTESSGGQWTVTIYNELGQSIYTKTGTGKINEQVNLENMAAGIYTVRLQTNNGISVKKLVITPK